MELALFSRTGLLWTTDAEYRLDWIRTEHAPIDELVHAGDSDIDEAIENWAGAHSIPTKVIEPDYVLWGPQAPFKRNEAIAEYVGPSGACVAFTAHLRLHHGLLCAMRVGMVVYRVDMEEPALQRYNAETSKMEGVELT